MHLLTAIADTVDYPGLDQTNNSCSNCVYLLSIPLDEDLRFFSRSKSDSCSLPSTPKSEATTTSEEELRICRTDIKKKRTQAYIGMLFDI